MRHYSIPPSTQPSTLLANWERGTLIAKSDIKSAFRLIPVYPGVFDLLGFHFKGAYYINKMLQFGCPISCKMFEHFQNF